MELPMGGRKVVSMRCTSTLHHDGAFCPDKGWEGSLHLVPSLCPSCAEITTHHRSGKAPGREEKDTLVAGYQSGHKATEHSH